MHRIPVNEKAFNNILSGKKKIEGRLKRGYFNSNKINVGDYINFVSKKRTNIVEITNIKEYPNISIFLKNENINHIIPGINCTKKAYKHYNKFYSKNLLNSHNFLAINIENI